MKKYNLLNPPLQFWGPSYEIFFKIKVKSFYGQVLHFFTGKKDEDGVPTVEAINHRLEVTTFISGRPMKFVTKQLKLKRWYFVSIKQLRSRKNPENVCIFVLNE